MFVASEMRASLSSEQCLLRVSFFPKGTFSPRGRTDGRVSQPAREISICFVRRRKTALAGGLCFSELDPFHFLPGTAACVCSRVGAPCAFQDGHMAPLCCIPAFAESPAMPGAAGSPHPRLVTVPADSRCALVLGQDPLRAWEQRGGWVSRQSAGCSAVDCWLLRLGRLPRLEIGTHTAAPIVRAVDSVDLGCQQAGPCHFHLRPHSYSQVPGRGVNFSR